MYTYTLIFNCLWVPKLYFKYVPLTSVTQNAAAAPEGWVLYSEPKESTEFKEDFEQNICVLVCFLPSLFLWAGCVFAYGITWLKTVKTSKSQTNSFLNSMASFMHGSLWLLGADCEICESTETARFSAAPKICWMQQIHDGMQPGSVFCSRLREYKAYTRKCFYLSHSGTTSSHNTTRETARVYCAPATSLASPSQE